MRFTHVTLGQRVLFGSGEATANLALEVAALGATRPMVIAGEHEEALADAVSAGIPTGARFGEVVAHVPLEVAERARAAARASGADVLVAVGGGSTTGLAKAIALTSGLPVIAVPTTYAGSEATDVWGVTENEHKTTGSDPVVLPRSVIYDAELTLSLPVALSTESALNAIAHCVDSLWAPRADPINRALALEGAAALDSAIRGIVAAPADIGSRERAFYGTYLAAVAFASAGSGMHHKICHVLGGMFNLPHASMHAVVLPYVLAVNAPAATEIVQRFGLALGSEDGKAALADLRRVADAPSSLGQLGMPESGIERAAPVVLAAIPPSNPRPVDLGLITGLLRAAWAGDPV
jgi:alcohol dehydrogenase class IV